MASQYERISEFQSKLIMEADVYRTLISSDIFQEMLEYELYIISIDIVNSVYDVMTYPAKVNVVSTSPFNNDVDIIELVEPYTSMTYKKQISLAQSPECNIYLVCAYDSLYESEMANEIFFAFVKSLLELYIKKDKSKITEISFITNDYFKNIANAYFIYKHGFSLSAIDHISYLPHEGRPCRGKLCFPINNKERVDECSPGFIKLDINEQCVVSTFSARNIRKLLELTIVGDTYLCANSVKISGVIVDPPANLPTIHFNGFGNWVLREGANDVLQSKGGLLTFPQRFPEQQRRNKMKDFLPINMLDDFIQVTNYDYPNGALIVVASKADILVEKDRLAKHSRCIPTNVEASSVTKDTLINFTSMDGAVLIDTDMNIHAIGAILDGDVKVKSTVTRGSRYNSAHNFVYTKKKYEEKNFMAIVVSSDKSVDVLC